MYQLTASTVFAQSGGSALWGVSDLALYEVGGALQLYAVDRVSQQIVTFEVGEAVGMPVVESARNIGGGHLPASGLALIEAPDGTFAVLTGASASDYSAYRILGSGSLSNGFDFTPATGSGAALSAAVEVSTTDGQFLVTSQHGQPGLFVTALNAELGTMFLQSVGTDRMVSDIAVIERGSAAPVVLAVDGTGHGLVSYRMAANGTLTEVSYLSALDGLAVYRPDRIEVATLDGQSYGILAASGTSSISVVAVGIDGALTLTDHVIDGRDTRFSAITELAVVEADGRVFVLAAGNDDGITLLELLPNGRLHHHVSLPDRFELPLDNVSGLVGALQENRLHVFAASETEGGIVELEFDLGNLGAVTTGGTGDDRLTGTSAGDVLYGGAGGNDRLEGGNGDDILIAGSGDDTLVGGGGKDVFVLGSATSKARILDFDPAQDIIDLSGLPFLYDVSQLAVVSLTSRFILSWGGVNISVYYPDTPGMTQEALLAAVKIDLTHSLVTIDPPNPNDVVDWFGTMGNDELVGGVTIDMFYATPGADSLDGGDNRDWITFATFEDGVKLDLLFPEKNEGELADDILISIEGIIGTAFRDVIEGDHAQNWFYGGAGDDILRGRAARDRLFGEDGKDDLNGGKGRDRLEGGAGNDLLSGMSGKDFLRGGTGHDTLRAGDHEDKLLGGKGNDVLDGGAGEDWLDGSTGNDTLIGGGGHDTFVFLQDHGDDVITDFNANTNREQIDLSALPGITDIADLLGNHAQQVGDDVRIDTGSGTILLLGVALSNLDAGDFIL